MSGFQAPSRGPAASPRPKTPVNLLGLPFDTLRALHATGVQAGLIRRSMLESRDFERALGMAERLMLGPWARRV